MKYGKARAIVESAIEQLDEMAFTKAAHKASLANIKAATKAAHKASRGAGFHASHPLQQAITKADDEHQRMGASDTIYDHDPESKSFKAVGELPKGAAQTAASQGQRTGSKSGMTKRHAEGLRQAAAQHKGIVVSAGWKDPDTDITAMDTHIPEKPRKGKVTKPSRAARGDYF